MNDQDSVQRLAEIRERAEKATSGPWENHGGMVGSPGHRAICGMLNVTGSAEMDMRDDSAYANASFIAHSREDVPYLLSLIDSLTAERDETTNVLLEQIKRKEFFIQKALADEARAELAEAEVKRLREALISTVATLGGAVEQIKALGSTPSDNAAAVIEEAISLVRALATPPSEGGQS